MKSSIFTVAALLGIVTIQAHATTAIPVTPLKHTVTCTATHHPKGCIKPKITPVKTPTHFTTPDSARLSDPGNGIVVPPSTTPLKTK